MRPLRDRPIKQKLVFITMVTTTAALIAAGLAILLADSILFRNSLRRDLTALAHIVADNSTGALSFNDPDAAKQTLAALRARTHVEDACIYRADGTALAIYARNPGTACPPAAAGRSIRTAGDSMIVAEPVLLQTRRIGTLMLVYNLGEIRERIVLYGSTVLGVIVGAGLLAFLLSSRLQRVVEEPIGQLVLATTAVSETGDYSIRARKLTQDELGLLVDRFNGMLARIQKRETDLKRAIADREAALHEVDRERERFRFMAESMPQKIFTAAPDGAVDYFNGQWMEFTGLSFDQIRGWGWEQFIHPDDLEPNVRAWLCAVQTGEPFHFEHRFRRADGRYRWHLSRAHAMRDANGKVIMWIGSNTDIHEQKEREQELRRANEDLQQFAYSASHDLQEPIRNVAVYSEIVAMRYAKALDDEGKQFLDFIHEGGRRLTTLVNDLLAYTRASMTELTETPLDSAEVLRRSLSNLSEAIRESGAIITHDPLPQVYMGASHLEQVFQNLIGNALKYRNEERPCVHIAAARQGSLWCFSVQDNGIGIDPQYKEKIFGVFKRLDHDRKYSGTGIGLAICQRVIERYGGRIRVESQPGKGSTFYFTVPGDPRAAGAAALESAAG